jgi:hypothetical protein
MENALPSLLSIYNIPIQYNIHKDTILQTFTTSEIKIDIMGLDELEKKVADHYNVLPPPSPLILIPLPDYLHLWFESIH